MFISRAASRKATDSIPLQRESRETSPVVLVKDPSMIEFVMVRPNSSSAIPKASQRPTLEIVGGTSNWSKDFFCGLDPNAVLLDIGKDINDAGKCRPRKGINMRKQARKPFDQSKIPNDLCPIATEHSELKTGDWRAERPVVDRDKCVKCATCWLYCPTQCVEEKPTWFQAGLEICKGCGVCAQECPHQAIVMVEEVEE